MPDYIGNKPITVDNEENKTTENVGKMLLAGFGGTTVTQQARKLIQKHKVASMILARKNFINVPQVKKLIQDLQQLAYDSGYKYPLILAVDQEGGMCNALFDEISLTQFPGAMALAATNDEEICYQVGKAIALELRSIGFNMYLGPTLDICSKMSNQLIGVRSFGSTVEEVTRFGKLFAKGIKDGGMFTVAKHFPGIGSSFVDNLLELPMMLETAAQLECFNILPFQNLIDEGVIDVVHAGGCAVPNISPNEIHACLSPVIIQRLLRRKLKFEGPVLSECLELEALCRNMGLGQGAITAILFARCDIVMVCHDLVYQEEALSSLRKVYETGNYETIFNTTVDRIVKLQKKLTWEQTFGPPEITRDLWISHQKLSIEAYKKSITLVRDYDQCIPLTRFLKPAKNQENRILLLTPLITSIHPEVHNLSSNPDLNSEKLFPGEEVFRDFGKELSKFGENNLSKDVDYSVVHTSYTANGLSNLHEQLIDNSKIIILVTSDASRHMYQIGVAKHISVLCGGYRKLSSNFTKKPLIIISVSSPYDFLYHNGIGSSYICTYEYTSNVLSHIPSVLFGLQKATGRIPTENSSADDLYDSPEDMMLCDSASPTNSAANSLTSKSLVMLLNDGDDDDKRIGDISDSKRGDDVYKGFIDSNMDDNGSSRRKRKKINKPWLVEEFNLARDFRGLILLLRNGSATGDDIFDIFLEKSASKIHQLLNDTKKTQTHFVVRNSTLNVIYGFCFTWVDSSSKCGRVMFIMVDRAKRRQSIGEMLHYHAIKYLSVTRGCRVILLGSSFPLLGFLTEKMLETFRYNFIEDEITSPNDQLQATKSSSATIKFLKSVGWLKKNYSTRSMKDSQITRKFILKSTLAKWSVAEKLVRQLQVVGIRFDICKDRTKLISLIEKYHSNEVYDEEKQFLDIYSKASNIIAEEELQKKNNGTSNTTIIVAIEPTTGSIVGSLIIFNNKSQLAKYYPFIDGLESDDDTSSRDDESSVTTSTDSPNEPKKGQTGNNLKSSSGSEIFGGLTGIFVDPNYQSLEQVFKLGLICTGVSFCKTLKVNNLMVTSIDEKTKDELEESGFEVFRTYYSHYAMKKSFEWVI